MNISEILYNTFYFWGPLLLLPIFLYAFIKLKRQRKEMIFSGIIFGIAAILIDELYAKLDY